MKRIRIILCAVLAVCVMVPAFASGAAVITPWENIYDESPAMCMDWYVKDGGKVWDRIIWNQRDFADMFENIPSYEYTDSCDYWSGTRGRYSVSIDTSYDVNVSDAVYDGNGLTFDYTASIDLAPDADGKTTYHGLLVLFYKAVSDSKEYYGEFNGYFDGAMDGYQIVKYVAPGTVGGQAQIESGEDIAIELPDNFDPAKHVIGYALWRIENKDIVYKYDIPETQEFPYIADPGTDSTTVKLFDLSYYIDNPPPKAPEPEPEPEPIMGDANGDGAVTLADVSLAMKYIAEWDVAPYIAHADMNGNGIVGLSDVSAMLRLIAGWEN
ncbi:MAG: dockerin type I repeat-containing protein [Clostridia bacterium]|nr:dockerin type I repeat-containing protein [Clostridia bacterium]